VHLYQYIPNVLVKSRKAAYRMDKIYKALVYFANMFSLTSINIHKLIKKWLLLVDFKLISVFLTRFKC